MARARQQCFRAGSKVVPSLLWLLGILLAACASDTSVAETEGFLVTGKVRDAESGKALKAVELRLYSDTLYETKGKTDSDGAYQLVIQSDTPHTRLELHKGGYRDETLDVFFDQPERQVDALLVRR